MSLPLFNDVDACSGVAPNLFHRRLTFPPELDLLARSTQPSVVFTSLAQLCVPVISDDCTAHITDDDAARYHALYPRLTGRTLSRSRQTITTRPQIGVQGEYTVRTWIDVLARDGHLGYYGLITHTWSSYCPNTRDVTRAAHLVEHAARVIRRERHS